MTLVSPEVGGTYLVRHVRKGIFGMRVSHVSDEWVDGVVVNGTAKAVLDYNVKEVGDEITVRRSLCSFEAIKP